MSLENPDFWYINYQDPANPAWENSLKDPTKFASNIPDSQKPEEKKDSPDSSEPNKEERQRQESLIAFRLGEIQERNAAPEILSSWLYNTFCIAKWKNPENPTSGPAENRESPTA